jgi:retron-type reverse transcriptase
MTIAEFPSFAREHWERLRSQIREGTYRPAPVRRVFIPKPDGSQRPPGHTDGAGSSDPAGHRPSAHPAL